MRSSAIQAKLIACMKVVTMPQMEEVYPLSSCLAQLNLRNLQVVKKLLSQHLV
jgi:hypothetical protein